MSAKSIQRLMYVVGFLDLLGVMLVIPLFVVHLKHLGMSPLMNGVVRSLYGVLQLVSAPLVGGWSDQWGRRPLLLVCLAVSALGYLALGASTSLWVVVASRMVTGIFKHSTTMCKAVLADVTTPSDRTRVMGKFNAAIGAAIILGPALGGHLTVLDDGFSAACRLSTAIFLVNCVTCLVFLPRELPLHFKPEDVHIPQDPSQNNTQTEKSTAMKTRTQFTDVLSEIDWKVFGDILLVDFFLTFSAFAYRSGFVLMVDQMFGASPKVIGYIISFQGAVGATAGFFTGKVSQYYGGNSQVVLFYCAVVKAAVLLGLTFASSITFTIILLVPLSVSGTLIHTATNTIIIDRCSPTKIGSVTGFTQSIAAVAGMITPVLTGLAQEAGAWGPAFLGCIFASVGAAVAGWAATYK